MKPCAWCKVGDAEPRGPRAVYCSIRCKNFAAAAERQGAPPAGELNASQRTKLAQSLALLRALNAARARQPATRPELERHERRIVILAQALEHHDRNAREKVRAEQTSIYDRLLTQ
jgi:hypothetical protein